MVATSAPSSSSRSAIACPIPRLAPVTTAACPLSGSSVIRRLVLPDLFAVSLLFALPSTSSEKRDGLFRGSLAGNFGNEGAPVHHVDTVTDSEHLEIGRA